jgi:hypothetical protein
VRRTRRGSLTTELGLEKYSQLIARLLPVLRSGRMVVPRYYIYPYRPYYNSDHNTFPCPFH